MSRTRMTERMAGVHLPKGTPDKKEMERYLGWVEKYKPLVKKSLENLFKKFDLKITDMDLGPGGAPQWTLSPPVKWGIFVTVNVHHDPNLDDSQGFIEYAYEALKKELKKNGIRFWTERKGNHDSWMLNILIPDVKKLDSIELTKDIQNKMREDHKKHVEHLVKDEPNRQEFLKMHNLEDTQQDWLEKQKNRNLTARLDEIAGELERVDRRLALAVDQVSDRLERVAKDNTITLPQAQRIYGPEVPWKLDEKDLEVINALLIEFPKRTLFGLTKEIKEALLSNKK